MTVSSSRTLDADGLIVGNADAIYTFTGRTIRPLDPDLADICIEDIAHSLAQQARFTGHLRRRSSVAEHCVRVAKLVPAELRLEALLHDGSETYLADIARPVKKAPAFGSVYLPFEAQLERAIQIRFQLPLRDEMEPEIKKADQYALEAEVAFLGHQNFARDMGVSEKKDAFGLPWRKDAIPAAWVDTVAEEVFLRDFRTYWNAREALKGERL